MFTIEIRNSDQLIDTIIALENNLESVYQRLRDSENYELNLATAHVDLQERQSSQFQHSVRVDDPENNYLCRKRDSYVAVINILKEALKKERPEEK